MAVVTHGSFDEGPIVLALPPVYEYAAVEETDPVFTAWDKSTGITITESQITDLGDYLVDADLTGLATETYVDVEVDRLVGVIESGLEDYIPYQGASSDANIGAYTFSAERMYVNQIVPLTSAEVVTKGWVESLVSGSALQTSVIDFAANFAGLPGVPSDGDRYITEDTGSIWQYETDEWVEYVPVKGWFVYVTNETVVYTYDGVIWEIMSYGSTVHNETLGLEGGAEGHYYHLGAADKNTVDIIIDTDTADTVTGLYVVDAGVDSGEDGTNLAWVELGWDASAYSAFDHYIVAYQKDGNLGWTEVIATSNSIVIASLAPCVVYNFKVYSVNKYGTVSTESATLQQQMISDGVAPDVTVITSATAGIQMILIEWEHNTAFDLSYYNVYRYTSDSSGDAVVVGKTKSNRYTDAPLPIDTKYYYWIKAVDTSGNECATFSDSVNATTRAVESEDVASISADKILLTGVTYLSNWTGTDSTKIDGGAIETNTVTLSKLLFTPGTGYGLVGAINAYEDGVQINASNIAISGATVFTSKVGGSYTSSTAPTTLSRISIYPDVNTGIKVTDNLGNAVFQVEIGGTNIGDVTIGNWAGNQGVKYDKSAGTLTVRGAIYASSGSISGVLDFGTSTATFGGKTANIAIQGCHIWENAYDGDNSQVVVNYNGYAGGTTHYRSFTVYNGKQRPLLSVGHVISGVLQDCVEVIGPLVMTPYYGVSYFMPPILTTTEMNALTKTEGMMIYNSTVRRFAICVKNISGVEEWWTVAHGNQIG
jgi:hypothetical protein